MRARMDFGDLAIVRYPHEPLNDRVWEFRHNLTAYDATFIALVDALDAPLVHLRRPARSPAWPPRTRRTVWRCVGGSPALPPAQAHVHVVVVMDERHHDVAPAPQAEPGSDEHVLRARGHEPVHEILRERAIDLPRRV